MATEQDPRVREDATGKELRAEEAARTAADELHDLNKQRTEVKPADENRPGFIGSIFQTVTGTLGSARDAVTGKTHEPTYTPTVVGRETADRERQNNQDANREAREKAGEYKDYAVEKSKETADATAQKAKDAKDYTADKAKEAKDATIGKMGEYKDKSVDMAKEAKDATTEKIGEYKDYASDKAKEAKDYTADKSKEGKDVTIGKLSELKGKAMDYLTTKKDETKEKMSESGDFAKGGSYETEEEARRKLETMRLKDQGYEAKGTRMDTSSPQGSDVIATVTETAEAFKRADQMSGQTFNDVGSMDDDAHAKGGVYRLKLQREKK